MVELHIVPLGALDCDIIPELTKALARHFRCRAVAGETVPLPDKGWDPGREQHMVTALQEVLAGTGLQEGSFCLGVTERDLRLPGFHFVFGAADARARVAVISLARLREEYYDRPADPALFLRRTVKEGVHELGHILGLSHCADPRCIMFFSVALADTDHKGPGFCAWCKELLSGRETDLSFVGGAD
jgi:archaemetzincin